MKNKMTLGENYERLFNTNLNEGKNISQVHKEYAEKFEILAENYNDSLASAEVTDNSSYDRLIGTAYTRLEGYLKIMSKIK